VEAPHIPLARETFQVLLPLGLGPAGGRVDGVTVPVDHRNLTYGAPAA
jgi:hypothetical protein